MLVRRGALDAQRPRGLGLLAQVARQRRQVVADRGRGRRVRGGPRGAAGVTVHLGVVVVGIHVGKLVTSGRTRDWQNFGRRKWRKIAKFRCQRV